MFNCKGCKNTFWKTDNKIVWIPLFDIWAKAMKCNELGGWKSVMQMACLFNENVSKRLTHISFFMNSVSLNVIQSPTTPTAPPSRSEDPPLSHSA